jgi:hypothetical protein
VSAAVARAVTRVATRTAVRAAFGAAACVVVAARTADAQTAGAPDAVHVAAGAARVAEPGGVATATFVARNPAPRERHLRPLVEAPAGWRALAGAGELTLAPGASQALVVSVIVPADAAAGDYAVRVRLAPADAPAGAPPDTASAAATVRVAERRAVRLHVVTPLPTLRTGERAAAQLRVVNRGNAAADVRVRGTATLVTAHGAAAAMPVTAEPAALRLAAGAAAVVTLTGVTPRDLPGATPLAVEVTAHAGDDEDAARETLRTLVVPDDDAPAPALALPLRAWLRAAPWGRGASAEIAGHGALGESGRATLELVARSGGAGAEPFDGRSEYRLAVRGARHEAVLGDQVLGLTPLTEPGRVGTGASAGALLGRVGVRAHAARSRAGSLGVASSVVGWAGAQQGASVALRAGAGEVGAAGVHRVGRDSGTMASAFASLLPARGVRLEVEAGHRLGVAGAAGDASRARLTLARGRLTGEARHLSHSRGEPGALRGARADAVEAALSLGRDLWVTASASHDRSGGGLADAALLGAGDNAAGAADERTVLRLPAERRSRAEAGVHVGRALAVEATTGTRVGTSGALAYDGVERALRLRLAGDRGPLSVAAVAEAGRVVDRSAARPATAGGEDAMGRGDGAVRRAAAAATLRLGWRGTLGGSFDVRSGPTLWSGRAVTRNAGLDATLALPAALRLRALVFVGAQRTLADGLVPVAGVVHARQTDLSLERALRGDRAVALRLRELAWDPGRAATDGVAPAAMLRPLARRAVVLEYGLPLRLPLGRAAGGGRLEARLVDAATGAGIPRALVRVGGHEALTDSAGVARMTHLPTGRHQLEVVDAGAAAGRVLVDPAALDVVASRTRVARPTLRYARSASLRGIACRAGAPTLARPVAHHHETAPAARRCADEAVAGARLVLTAGADTVHLVTDKDGAFSAVGLRPGRWQVRIAGGDLPATDAFAAAEREVDVGEAGEIELTFEAAPRPRPVRALQISAGAAGGGDER